ncbi:MAG: hypothetical protein AB1492_03350 [Bacillota bacterium]
MRRLNASSAKPGAAADVGRALDAVKRAAAEIRADREFRPKLGHLCPWCNRLDGCAMRDQVPPKPAGVT